MAQNTTIDKQKQRAKRLVERQNSFIQRNYVLWVVVAYLFYPVASLLSALTEGSHVFLRTSEALPPILAGLATLLVVILIEGTKFYCGKGMVDDIQADVFSDGGPGITLFFLKVIGFIGAMGFSVYLSLSFMPEITERFTESRVPVESVLVSIDSIEQKFEAEMLPYHQNIAAMQKTTWKGSITRTANKSILKDQEVIAQIQTRKDAAITQAMEENQIRKADYEEQISASGKYNTGFAGLAELICAFALIFIGLYDQGVKNEVGSAPSITGSGGTSGHSHGSIGYKHAAQANEMIAPAPTPRRPIGFVITPPVEPPPVPRVATYSYTDETEESYSDEMFLYYYAKAKAHRDSWNSATRGTPENIAERVEEYESKMNWALEQLAKKGLEAKKIKNRWQLVPLA